MTGSRSSFDLRTKYKALSTKYKSTQSKNKNDSFHDKNILPRLQVAGINNHVLTSIYTRDYFGKVSTATTRCDWLLKRLAVLYDYHLFDSGEGYDRVVGYRDCHLCVIGHDLSMREGARSQFTIIAHVCFNH